MGSIRAGILSKPRRKRSAHAIDREFKVLQALFARPVPAPGPLVYHTDSDIVGTPFLMSLQGRVFHDSSRPGVTPVERRQMYLSMAYALAGLHAVDPKGVGLADFGRCGDYFARQLARWSRQWAASSARGIPELDTVITWLQGRLPEQEGPSSITHSDYRIGNLIFHPTDPRVVGILDWELATLGAPLADFGFCCMTWFIGPYEYVGIAGLDLDALGIPAIDNFVARYERRNSHLDAAMRCQSGHRCQTSAPGKGQGVVDAGIKRAGGGGLTLAARRKRECTALTTPYCLGQPSPGRRHPVKAASRQAVARQCQP